MWLTVPVLDGPKVLDIDTSTILAMGGKVLPTILMASKMAVVGLVKAVTAGRRRFLALRQCPIPSLSPVSPSL